MIIVIPLFIFGKSGGFRTLSNIANGLVDRGHSVTFLVSEQSSPPYYPTNADIYRYTTFKVFPYLNGMLNLVKVSWLLSTKFRNTDVVIATEHMTAYPVVFSPNSSAKKIYYIQAYEPDFYNEKPPGLKTSIGRWLCSQSYRLPLIRVVNSPIYLNYLELHSDTVIPPGVDRNIFQPRTSQNHGHDTVFGCIGRKASFKGTSMIIDAFREVSGRATQSLRLKIAFELPDDVDLSDDRSIELVEPHGDSHLADFYNSLDAFIAIGTTQFGAYYYPIMESLACETPLIAGDYAPANADNSFFIEPLSHRTLVEQFEVFLGSSQEDIAKKSAAGQNAINGLAWDRIVDKWEELLNDIAVKSD